MGLFPSTALPICHPQSSWQLSPHKLCSWTMWNKPRQKLRPFFTCIHKLRLVFQTPQFVCHYAFNFSACRCYCFCASVCISGKQTQHFTISIRWITMATNCEIQILRFFSFSHLYRASWYYQNFVYSPTHELVSCLKKNIKIYIKIYIKTAVLM